ncbi:MAG TPA: LCP family protein [Acidimicrobiales bacterium]|nr:LCP family protein [Acidimicrobiales bacterium]
MRTPRRKRGHRTWPQRLLLTLNASLVVVALAVAASLGYAYERFGSLPRVELGSVLTDAADSPGEAVNILMVGYDSSEGLDPDDPRNIGRNPASQLADTIMILRIDPATTQAALISIPRDLWVPIADKGYSAKINTSYAVGGPPTLIATIEQYLGIPINNFVAVDFDGFRQVVAAIGGVEVYFPTPARDRNSGLDIPVAGCQVLDPDMALAYARSRQYQFYEDGRWQIDPFADFTRMRRQQDFLRRALSRAIDRGVRNPATANALLNSVDDAVLLDDRITTGDILDIANRFRTFNPESLATYTLQDLVVGDTINGQSALRLREADAQPVLDLFRGIQTGLDPTPASVRVRVLNGSGSSSQASDVAGDLRLAGFTVTGTDNARSLGLARTTVRHAPGQRAAASLVARHLVVEPLLEEDPDLIVAPVELVTGDDYAGLLAEPRPAGPSTAEPTTPTSGPTTSAVDTPDPDADGATDPPPEC